MQCSPHISSSMPLWVFECLSVCDLTLTLTDNVVVVVVVVMVSISELFAEYKDNNYIISIYTIMSSVNQV